MYEAHGFAAENMDRRQLLKSVCVGTTGIAATAIAYNLQSWVLAAQQGRKVSWGYIGKEGAENWGRLSPQFLTCRLGQSQSPINLTSAIRADIANFQVNYKSSALKIVNNGHTIRVDYDAGSALVLDGQVYELIQFHFHNPSEHTVDGKSYPMELHLVHKSQQGSIAVLGIFLQQGKENQTLQAIWQMMPHRDNTQIKINDVVINAKNLIPKSQQVYRYYGSLTTPPCSENVNWIVFQEPVEISPAQIQQFAQIFPMNARPVQKLNRRFLLRSLSN